MTTLWSKSSTLERRTLRTCSVARESRFPVGSSAKTTAGRPTMERAQAVRWTWPPESSAGRWDRRSDRPTASTTWSKRLRSTFRRAMSRGRVMFSPAVREGTRLKDWNTKPMRSRRSLVSRRWLMEVISCPSRAIVPEVADSRPARQCMRVDLPDPEGPMIAVKRARAMETSTPSSAVTAFSPRPKTLNRARAVTTGSSTGACSIRPVLPRSRRRAGSGPPRRPAEKLSLRSCACLVMTEVCHRPAPETHQGVPGPASACATAFRRAGRSRAPGGYGPGIV